MPNITIAERLSRARKLLVEASPGAVQVVETSPGISPKTMRLATAKALVSEGMAEWHGEGLKEVRASRRLLDTLLKGASHG